MGTSRVAFWVFAVICWPDSAGAQLDDELRARLERADQETVRLQPSNFIGPPNAVKATLSRLGCRIPQPWGDSKPRNLIRGEFMEAGRLQWAALCSRDRSSAIMVIDEKGLVRAELASRPDRGYLQGIGNGKIGFSRQLTPVGRDFILARYRAYGGQEPPAIDHEGIDDSFLGKASIVLYFHEGNWLDLTGSD